jgi:hypothetical protein
MRMPIHIVLATFVGILSPALQAQAPGSRDSVAWAALSRLRPGSGVRVHTAELGRLEGRFLSLTDAAVTVGHAPADTRVALAGIDSLWQRGSAWKTGAIVGGIVGTLLGAATVYVAASSEDFSDTPPLVFAAAVAIPMAGGALLGAGVGALIPTWRRRKP